MCMVGDADTWDFFAAETPRARKPHRCEECDRTIQPGERYERSFGVIDGAAMTQRVCAHCVEARRWLDRVCGGWLYSAVLMDLGDHIGEGYRDAALVYLAELAVQDWRIARRLDWSRPVNEPKLVPVELVRKLVDESLAYQKAVGHLGRERWAA
jgi:hypothetical protein